MTSTHLSVSTIFAALDISWHASNLQHHLCNRVSYSAAILTLIVSTSPSSKPNSCLTQSTMLPYLSSMFLRKVAITSALEIVSKARSPSNSRHGVLRASKSLKLPLYELVININRFAARQLHRQEISSGFEADAREREVVADVVFGNTSKSEQQACCYSRAVLAGYITRIVRSCPSSMNRGFGIPVQWNKNGSSAWSRT